jgi:hypothetical protein
MCQRNIDYLLNGNEKQVRMYNILTGYNILETLAPFDPVVVSTICVGLDIDSSDIDIICSTKSPSLFKQKILDNYKTERNFKIWYSQSENRELVCSFFLEEFDIEIFASPEPVEQQNAYKHFSVMKHLINLGGDSFCADIRKLKQNGLKTEPAIAMLLNLKGNPFLAVLDLLEYSDKQLMQLLKEEYLNSMKTK